jgi:hypothetical protein
VEEMEGEALQPRFSALGCEPSADYQRQGNTLGKEVAHLMQYAVMVDLIEQARLAGAGETESVRDSLDAVFENWLNRQDLREITEEEVEALHASFTEGFTNYYNSMIKFFLLAFLVSLIFKVLHIREVIL